MTMAFRARPAGETTQRSIALVAARRPDAEALGRLLAELVDDPDAFVRALRGGFERLADPAYLAGQQLVAPGIGALLGVRSPLMEATARTLRAHTRDASSSQLLFVADRLLRDELLELRWFALGILDRTIGREPERTWQLLRPAAHAASDWITVDTLARPAARGILSEPYRWAELEQLVFSPSRWERRLVGSTIATMPFVDRSAGRTQEYVERALALLGQLIGDAEPDVQKALAWAYRSVTQIDRTAVGATLELETDSAAAAGDGNRAWVIRDVLPRLDAELAARLHGRLHGVRRRPGSGSTSVAGEIATRFADPERNERSLGDTHGADGP